MLRLHLVLKLLRKYVCTDYLPRVLKVYSNQAMPRHVQVPEQAHSEMRGTMLMCPGMAEVVLLGPYLRMVVLGQVAMVR